MAYPAKGIRGLVRVVKTCLIVSLGVTLNPVIFLSISVILAFDMIIFCYYACLHLCDVYARRNAYRFLSMYNNLLHINRALCYVSAY